MRLAARNWTLGNLAAYSALTIADIAGAGYNLPRYADGVLVVWALTVYFCWRYFHETLPALTLGAFDNHPPLRIPALSIVLVLISANQYAGRVFVSWRAADYCTNCVT
jgi:hypothetical protein